jgi:hypothetical protein
MLILEENESYNAIIGSGSAPYVNGLATTYSSATKWYAVQGNSPHDYLDLIVGSDLGLPNGQPYSTPTLVDELHTAGIPWRAYMENMPSDCVKGGGSSNGLYDTNHNPFIHFTNYLSSSPAWWCSAANLSSEGVVPYSGSTSLVSDLTATNAPDFVFISPNDCDEMHGDTSTGSPCAGASNSALIKAGDNWLSSNIAPVLNSTWFKQNGIVIITWDEATGDSSGCCGLTAPGGHIATIVVSANNKGLGAFTGIGDHFGTLRALEESYGVGLLGGSSKPVNGDLTGAFGSAPTTGSIGGTVKDAQTSAGITGATVTCTCSSGGVSTGTGGSYSFANVAPGTYSMTFSQPGYVTQSLSNVAVTSGHATTENVALTRPPGTITGQVTDGTAITHPTLAGATVTCTCQTGSTTTTASGNYSFTSIPPGSYSLTVSDAGYVTQTVTGVTVTSGNTTTENVALTEDGGITGTVTDAQTGNPISGVAVTCGGGCPTTTATTDVSGAYSFTKVPNGSAYSLSFAASGYVTQTITGVTVTGPNTTSANIALTEDGGISGTVTDAQTSMPIAGVTVTCSACGTTTATTDGSGLYAFTNVAPSTYSLTFSDTGYVAQTATGIAVTPGTTSTESVALTEDGGISGTVTDQQTGTPIVAVTVTCAGGCPTTSAATDGLGNYAFAAVPNGSSYSLTFAASGYVTQTITGVAVAGPATTTENVALTEDGAITGTVTDAQTNSLLPGVTVICSGGCPSATTTTDGSGDYTFTMVPSGSTYSLRFTASGYVTQTINGVTVTAPNTTSENVALTEDGGLSGVVTNASTHAAIPNATVTCTCRVGSVTTNSTGAYSFTQVVPGSYTASVAATSYVGQTSSPFTVSPGGTTTQNFQLSAVPQSPQVVRTFGAAGTTGSTTLSASTSIATGAGDLLVVTVKDRSSSLTNVVGVTDSSGHNTWAKAVTTQFGQGDEEIWYVAGAASATSVIVTVSGTASLAMTVVDIAGATATPLDKTMTATGASTTASTGTTLTTSQASEIVIADIGWNSAVSPSQQTIGYTPLLVQQSTVSGNQTGEQAAWLVVNATGAQSFAATLSSSVAWIGAIATFK